MLFICKADKKNLSLGICVCLSVCVRTENIFLYMVSVYVLWVYILMLVENRGKQIGLFICKLIKEILSLGMCVSLCLVCTENIFLFMVSVYVLWVYILMLVVTQTAIYVLYAYRVSYMQN